MIQEFIKKLDDLKSTDPVMLERIKNYHLLMEALTELDKMVGMNSFKADVISMIKNYLISDFNGTNRNHSIISGPPGCGKTTLAKILAKIYVSLGLIKREKTYFDTFTETEFDLSPTTITIGFTLLSFVVYMPNIWTLLLFIIFVIYVVLFGVKTVNKNKIEISGDDDYFIMLHREDFISEYLGQSDKKTRSLLDKCIGKVIFIDEAYKLVAKRADIDPYGNEALNVLIEWMDENRGKCLVIFGGYEKQMNETIFRSQPGLKRRCQKTYHIEAYTADELYEIFRLQLKNKKMKLNPVSSDLNQVKSLFFQYYSLFPFSGGDTERLVDYVEQIHNSNIFDSRTLGIEPSNFITPAIVEQAIGQLKQVQRAEPVEEKNLFEKILEAY